MTAVVGSEPRRRAILRFVDALGRLGERAGLAPRPISGPRILDAVRRKTGLEDLGPGPAEEGIRVLTASIETGGRPGAFGRQVARGMVAQGIERRLRIVDLLKRTPEIAEQRIRRPLFIVSPPRTGTTLLYNLLAQDPHARPLLSWEAYHPLPLDSSRNGRDPRIGRHRRGIRVLDWLAPDLQRIHPVVADGPEECVPLLMRTFVCGAWSMFCTVPTYDRWVRSRPPEDYLDVYRFHRDQLRMLQWQRNGDGAWLLKSPAHTLALPALLRTYPDAVVVRTHRDVAKVLPSACSLFRAARAIVEGPVDADALGRAGLGMAEDLLHRVMRPIPDADRDRVIDVRYADLVADPVGTAERIQAAAGRDVSPRMRAAMEAWLAENPRHKQAVHRYRLEDYGITRDEVEALAGEYHRRFGVPRE